jgi:hypothetical protein
MALIVQTDDGLTANANSYATVAEFIAYWADRGEDYSTTPTTAQIESYLIKGWEYTDTAFKYNGTRLNGRTQTTQFPRENLYDCEYNLVEGIPYEIKNAQMEYAKRELDGTTLQEDGNPLGAVKRTREKVDVIEEEIEYSGSGQTGGKVAYPTADNKIPKSFICQADNNQLWMN